VYWVVSYFRRAAPTLFSCVFSCVFSCAIFPVSERAKFSKARSRERENVQMPWRASQRRLVDDLGIYIALSTSADFADSKRAPTDVLPFSLRSGPLCLSVGLRSASRTDVSSGVSRRAVSPCLSHHASVCQHISTRPAAATRCSDVEV